jgi:hypothetical protein
MTCSETNGVDRSSGTRRLTRVGRKRIVKKKVPERKVKEKTEHAP